MALFTAEQKAVDIAMTTFNRFEIVKKCIESVFERTRYPYNLHVIDNASTDGTQEYLIDLWKQRKINRLILNDYNTGVTMPKAQSVALCSSPYFIITDSDITPPDVYDETGKCWLQHLLERMKTDPQLMMLTLAISKARSKPWAHANGINYCRYTGHTFQMFNARAFESMGKNPPVISPERKCDDANKQPVFSTTDTRLCNLVTRAGYRVGYTHELWGDHIGSGITDDDVPFWGYGSMEEVPQPHRVVTPDEYLKHGYVACDPKTNRPIEPAFIKRYHTINAIAAFGRPFNPDCLNGFKIMCAHYPNGAYWKDMSSDQCPYLELIEQDKLIECDGHYEIYKV